MPDTTSSDTAAYVNAASNAINNASGILAQSSLNRKTRKWNEEMYQKQRQDAIADWDKQNLYNHPTQQMARLREAGLNPNLVYGKGADNTSQAVRSTDVKSWNPQAPDFSGFTTPFADMYNFEMKQAQIDNLRVQNTVLTQEAILKAASTASTLQQTEKGKFDLGLAQDLRSTSLQAAQESLRKLTADTDYTLHQDERAALQSSQSLKEGVERILNMRSQRATDSTHRAHLRQQIENLTKDAKLKELDIELKKLGIQPTDNIFLRAAGRVLNSDTLKNALPPSKEFKPWDQNWRDSINRNRPPWMPRR